jgi:ribosomal-protein-alanine N-acetyltransferase
MPLTIRFMRRQDISQVTEIDHEAFPTEWPPTNFTHELENKLAYYLRVSGYRSPIQSQIL